METPHYLTHAQSSSSLPPHLLVSGDDSRLIPWSTSISSFWLAEVFPATDTLKTIRKMSIFPGGTKKPQAWTERQEERTEYQLRNNSSRPMQYCSPFLLPRSYVFMPGALATQHPVHDKELIPHSHLMVHCSSQITELSGCKIGQATLGLWNALCFLFLCWWQREVPMASTHRIIPASNNFYFISLLLKKRE